MIGDFDNKERRRYYGVRVGDTVTYDVPGIPVSDETYTVVGYGFMDNNCVYLKSNKDGSDLRAVAEYCRIVKKVDDDM